MIVNIARSSGLLVAILIVCSAMLAAVYATSSISDGRDDVWWAITDHDEHIHGYRRWFGAAASPTGETHIADRMSVTPFVIPAGDDAFGAWVQLLGSDDTPAQPGKSIFCPYSLQISAYNQPDTIHLLQIAIGDSPAQAIATGDVTDLIFMTRSTSMPELHPRTPPIPVGEKVWCRVHALGKEVASISGYLGIHE